MRSKTFRELHVPAESGGWGELGSVPAQKKAQVRGIRRGKAAEVGKMGGAIPGAMFATSKGVLCCVVETS